MTLPRVYDGLLAEHLAHLRQMALVCGPRQVGKTTTARACAPGARYLNWDHQDDRLLISAGPAAVADALGLSDIRDELPVAVLDEVHKFPDWKRWLKGFFDVHGQRCRLVVTGSSRLDVFRRGGDSLMGRYFLYRMHPLSVAEVLTPAFQETLVRPPCPVPDELLPQLLELGGFPEPFLHGTRRFYNRWRRLRTDQLLREDLRDLTRVREVAQLQLLADLIQHQSGQLVSYTPLAARVGTAVDTIRRWLSALEQLYYCFRVGPWHRNIPKSLIKQPKVYLWDWSVVKDPGSRRENLVACHLLKAAHLWTDAGLGRFDLYFLRDKVGREVDFLVTRESEPWLMVEVKSAGARHLSPALHHYHQKLTPPHAVQLAYDLPQTTRSCFDGPGPLRVPAATFLSQLV